METGKPGLVSAPVRIGSIAAQTEKRMDVQAPLTAVYIHTVPALPAQPYPQASAASREPATLHLAMPPLYTKETLPFLTLHIAGGLQSQPGLSLAAAAPAARSKSAGKHVCPHCGRDCMKPSVLEKHLRCHTGERPYPCTTCGISFKTQSNLYKHKRTQAHARLSSESDQSSMGSQDSMSSSRETHTSGLSVDECTDESGIMEKEARPPTTTSPDFTTEACFPKAQGSVSVQSKLTPADHTTEPNERTMVTEEKKQMVENEKPPFIGSRHLPLQRQEAMLFSKLWESSVSSGKSQSHESTDSGFSESSDHYLSPASILPDHSMDSLTESTKEHVDEKTSTYTETGRGGQEPKDAAREREHEQKTLEERISKLISDNTALVEDKQLDNVRPRKTVLSKQGSIDLPMPYTYKDSFHFDIKISKTPNVGLQRNKKPGLYSSVPTQCSTTEHAPLTRSNSLPFSVTLLQPERSSPKSSCHSDYVTLIRRGSSGQINPTSFTIPPVSQQLSTHRPLVRQTAVDCNHATDGLFANSSVEEACTGSLSCDGDGGDICAEQSNRKSRRKNRRAESQKFAYNKWYMYGGGTFKKLYNTEKGGDNTGIKGRKCINPELEAVQKRLSVVHKEAVTTPNSTTNITTSSVTLCHPGCPPAKTPLISAEEFDLNTSQLCSSSSFLKTPLRRNLSLSMLPLPSIGSLVSHKPSIMISTEAGRFNNERKPADSPSQLGEAHIPSDRKKQRTDDKIIYPLKMESDPNTVTHPPPSVTGSVPQPDTHPSYINFQTNVKQTQLEAALFTPCKINPSIPSVNTSLATSILSAKTSFLPKYQLKLPNAAEPNSNGSPQIVDKPPGTDVCTSTSALPSSNPEKKCTDSLLLPSMQTIIKTNAFNSTQAQLLSPCTATTYSVAKTPRLCENVSSFPPVMHRQVAATTITTTCLKDFQAGLCSTLIQPSNSEASLVPLQSPRPAAPVVSNFPATLAITTANSETSADAPATPSQGQHNSNPPHSSHFSPTSDHVSPVNGACVGTNTPGIPCPAAPLDQVQPAAHNVFHVHTADLQICLQIISDEQLALIEPQIERHAGCGLLQRHDMEALAVQNKAQSSVTVEISSKGRDHQQPGQQRNLNPSQSLTTFDSESIKPPLSVHFGKLQPNLHMTNHTNSSQVTVSAVSLPSETLGSTPWPHKYSNVSMDAETMTSAGNVMSTAALLLNVKSGTHQTSEEEPAIYMNSCAEKQTMPDRRVSQDRPVLQTLPVQHSFDVTCLSPSTVNPNSTRREESQEKLHKAVKAKCEASSNKNCRSEGGESHLPLEVKFSRASVSECAASPFPDHKSKPPCRLNPQSSICCDNPSEPASSETVSLSKYANRGCDRGGPSDNSASLVEPPVSESQDVLSSGQFTSESSNLHVEESKDTPAALTSTQRPAAGLVEGAFTAGSEGQKKLRAWGHGGTPERPHCSREQSQEAGETNLQSAKGQGGGGATGEDKNREVKAGQGEDRKVKVDSFKSPWVPEQHLQHLSQAHSGMSKCHPQSPQQPQSTSNDHNVPLSSSQTSLFNSPQTPLEVYFSQQQQWENTIIHNHQTQTSCESNSREHLKAQARLPESQNAFLLESSPKKMQTYSHPDQKQIPSVQQGNTANSSAERCCAMLTLGSQESSGLSPDVKTTSVTHHCHASHSPPGSRGSAGWTENTQTSSNHMVDLNAGLPSKAFTYIETEQDTKDWPQNDYMTQFSNSGRPDITNKYQSFLLAGQFHGFQPGECLTSGVRPVQSCQDYSEDTSSSDDEGKLIIEL